MTTYNHAALLTRLTAITLLLSALAATASAQTMGPGLIGPPSRPERPYRGLFGGGAGDTAQKLTIEGSAGGGLVYNPLVEQGQGSPTDPASTSGGSGSGSTTIAYTMDRARMGISADYKFLLDYYPELGENSKWDRHFVAANFYFLPSQSTRVAIVPGYKNVAELTASELFDTTIDGGVAAPLDKALTIARYHRYGVVVEVSHKLSNRISLQGDVNYGHGKVEAGNEWLILTGSGTLSYRLRKGIALSLGYRDGGQRDIVEGRPVGSVRHPRIQGGLDINQPLSFSRRTLVTFASGIAGTQDRLTGETVYHVIGGARLTREIGRTWSASTGYDRGLRRLEPLSESILVDAVTAGVQGSFNQRLQFKSQMGYSTGDVQSTGGTLKNVFGGVQLSFAITKMLGLGADYSLYDYSATENALPTQVVTKRQTSSVRTYLELWMPLFTRTKRN